MRFLKYIFLFVIGLSLSFCSGLTDDELIDQQEDIESYMDSNYTPYEDLGQVYRKITNADASAAVITKGSVVSYSFAGYSLLDAELFDTNDATLIAELEEAGLAQGVYSSDPEIVTIGKSDILAGVEKGLKGCQEGDYVVLAMTSEMGFGDKLVGTVQRNSPLLFLIQILTVN